MILDDEMRRGSPSSAVRYLATVAVTGAAGFALLAGAPDPATAHNGRLVASVYILRDGDEPGPDEPQVTYELWLKRPGRHFSPIQDGVVHSEHAVSHDGRWLAYFDWQTPTLLVRHVSRSGRLGPRRALKRFDRVHPGVTDISLGVGWSADGRRLAVMSTGRSDDDTYLTILRRDGRLVRRVRCDCPGGGGQPVWSRRGTIVYSSGGVLYRVDASGHHARRMFRSEQACEWAPPPTWTRDGRKVSFACGRSITTLDLATGARRAFKPRLIEQAIDSLAWAPDGRSIALAAGPTMVEVRSDGTRAREIPMYGYMSWGGVSNLAWVP